MSNKNKKSVGNKVKDIVYFANYKTQCKENCKYTTYGKIAENKLSLNITPYKIFNLINSFHEQNKTIPAVSEQKTPIFRFFVDLDLNKDKYKVSVKPEQLVYIERIYKSIFKIIKSDAELICHWAKNAKNNYHIITNMPVDKLTSDKITMIAKNIAIERMKSLCKDDPKREKIISKIFDPCSGGLRLNYTIKEYKNDIYFPYDIHTSKILEENNYKDYSIRLENTNKLPEYNFQKLEKYIDNKKSSQKQSTSHTKNNNNICHDENSIPYADVEIILDILAKDSNYYDDYNKWREIGAILAYHKIPIEYYLKFSKKSDKYEKDKCYEVYMKANGPDTKKISTFATLVLWAKDIDASAVDMMYEKYRNDYFPFHPTQANSLILQDITRFLRYNERGSGQILAKLLYGEVKFTSLKNPSGYVWNNETKLWLEIDTKYIALGIASDVLNARFCECLKFLVEYQSDMRQKIKEIDAKLNNIKSAKSSTSNFELNTPENNENENYDELSKELTGVDNKREKLQKMIFAFNSKKTIINKSTFIKSALDYAVINLVDKKFEENINSAPYLIPTKDGNIIDIITLKIRERNKSDYFSSTFNANFNAKLDLSDCEKYISSLMNDDKELANYFHRLLGYFITGYTSEKLIFINYGCGDNGKSALFSLMDNMMGEFYGTADRNLVCQNRGMDRSEGSATPHLMVLRKSRLVVYADMKEEEKLNVDLLKKITGSDKISARQMYGEQITIASKSKIAIHANNKPDFNIDDGAMVNRIKMIPYSAKFKNNPNISKGEKYRDEKLLDNLNNSKLDNFFTYIAIGANKWFHKRLDVDVPKIIENEKKKYISELDIIQQFIDDICVLDNKALISSSELYECFKTYHNASIGGICTSQKKFSSSLKNKGFISIKKNTGAHFKGIKIIEIDDTDDFEIDNN